MSTMLQGLAPVIDERTRLVILGSFPGVASLQAHQYYGHPRNQFWPILSALWLHADDTPLHQRPYEQRIAFVLEKGVGIWDVYAHCERQGSLDSAIRSPQLNDLASMRQWAPRLEAIVHNGGESARAMRLTQSLGLVVHQLPSTSPANASWSFQRKLDAWRAVFQQHALCE